MLLCSMHAWSVSQIMTCYSRMLDNSCLSVAFADDDLYYDRPESRAGQHSPSHLHPPAPEAISPQQSALDSGSSTTNLAAISQPSGAGSIGSAQHAQRAQQGHAGVADSEGQDDGSMSVVRAAALAASSPGAIVKVPTSAALSQADQIALRYQYQASDNCISA